MPQTWDEHGNVVTAPVGEQRWDEHGTPVSSAPAGNLSRVPEEKPVPSIWSGEYSKPMTVGNETINSTVAPGESLPHAVTRQAIGGIKSVFGGLPKMFEPAENMPQLGVVGNAAANLVLPQVEQGKKAYQDLQHGNYSEAVGHGVAAITPGVGPMVANATEQAQTGTVGPSAQLGTMAALPTLGKSAVEPVLGKIADAKAANAASAMPDAIKTIKEGLKGGKNVESNIDRATPYLQEVGRSNPKTAADVHAGLDAQRAKIGQALQDQVQRHPEVRVSGDDVANAVKGEISDADRKLFPDAVKQVDAEVARYAGKDLTAPQALEVAAKLRAMKKSYFNAAPADQAAAENASGSVRAIDAAHDAIVNHLAERLEATGETGVKDMRADYGALRNLTDAAYKAKVKEGQMEAPSFGRSIQKELGSRGTYYGLGALGTALAGEPLAALGEAALIPAISGMRYLNERNSFGPYKLTKGLSRLGELPGDLPDYTPTKPNIRGALPPGAIPQPAAPVGEAGTALSERDRIAAMTGGEVADPFVPPSQPKSVTQNFSGQGEGYSTEADNRIKSQNIRGVKQFMIDKGGRETPLAASSVDAVDLHPRTGQALVERYADGTERVIERGAGNNYSAKTTPTAPPLRGKKAIEKK